MEEDNIKGKPMSIYDQNMAMYGHGDPDMIGMDDPKLKKYGERARLRMLTEGIRGQIIIFGTGGEVEKHNNFKDIFYEQD